MSGSRGRPVARGAIVLALGALCRPAVAQESPASAALLFGYRLRDGQETQFYEGYARHLEWHRQRGDSLIWYGWTVLIGDAPGVFVDGTFGRPFLAIDRRVDPAGDQRDFAETAGAFAEPVFRRAYLLRRDLSTATPLEDGMPTPLLEVLRFRVRPGAEAGFEALARSARDELRRRTGAPQVTWYELVSGGAQPTFLALVHRHGLADWDADPHPPRLLGGSGGGDMVLSVESETWRYLPAASLIPPRH